MSTNTVSLDSLSVNELRKMMRERHPETRGTFSAMARKEVCLDVLEGRTVPKDAVRAWRQEVGEDVELPKKGFDMDSLDVAKIADLPPHILDLVSDLDADELGLSLPEDAEVECPECGKKGRPSDSSDDQRFNAGHQHADSPIEFCNSYNKGGNAKYFCRPCGVNFNAEPEGVALARLQRGIEMMREESATASLAEGVSGPGAAVSADRMAKAMQILQVADPDAAKAFGMQSEVIRALQQKIAEQAGPAPDHRTGKVVEVDGQKAVKLDGSLFPVFDRVEESAYFIPAEDPDFRFDYWNAQTQAGALKFKQSASDLMNLIIDDWRCLLVGPPSVGKTALPTQFAAKTNWPLTRFNGNRDVTMDDFVGTFVAKGGETHWVDGPLARAMRHGHIFVIDEVDHMPAECSSTLHSVLEPGGHLLISRTGEVIKPHENFRLIATANTAGFGDDTGLHPNAQVQDAAFLSRFQAVFHVGYPTRTQERDLLVARYGVAKKLATLISNMANETRRAAEKRDIMYPITIRQTMAFADASRTLPVSDAFVLTILAKLPTTDRQAVVEIAQRHLGKDLGGKVSSGSKDSKEDGDD